MLELRDDRHFDTWTLAEVAAVAEQEPRGRDAGSGRRVLGPLRKLLEAMRALGANRSRAEKP